MTRGWLGLVSEEGSNREKKHGYILTFSGPRGGRVGLHLAWSPSTPRRKLRITVITALQETVRGRRRGPRVQGDTVGQDDHAHVLYCAYRNTEQRHRHWVWQTRTAPQLVGGEL